MVTSIYDVKSMAAIDYTVNNITFVDGKVSSKWIKYVSEFQSPIS